MNILVRCTNPACGHPTLMGTDPPGRVFRCPRCQSKLSSRSHVRAEADKSSELVLNATVSVRDGRFTPPRPIMAVVRPTFDDQGRQGRGCRAEFGSPGSTWDALSDLVAPHFDDDDPDDVLDAIGREPSTREFESGRQSPGAGRRPGSTAMLIETEGERMGRYRILGLLGEGRHARVYRAHDPILDRDLAVKVLRPGLLGTDRRRERFLAEARALALLRHPRIIPVFEAGRDGQDYYIAMPLIEGRGLDELLREDRLPLDVRRATSLIAELAGALDYAHGQGIVHRDIKPANIRIDPSGDVHLMDFGIACRGDSGEFRGASEALLGTPAYVAPEQASGPASPILPASDQYSLGVVFYELLCGLPPFRGTPLNVLLLARSQQPAPPRTVNPAVPARLSSICMKTLAKSPVNRFKSCGELADRLRGWLKG